VYEGGVPIATGEGFGKGAMPPPQKKVVCFAFKMVEFGKI